MAGTTKRPAAADSAPRVTRLRAARATGDGREPSTIAKKASASPPPPPPSTLAPPAAEESNAAPSLDSFDPETRAAVDALLEAVPDASVLASPNPRAAEAARRALAALYKYSLRSLTHANGTAAAATAGDASAAAAPSTPAAAAPSSSLPPGVLPELYAGPGFDVEQVSFFFGDKERRREAFVFLISVVVQFSLGGPTLFLPPLFLDSLTLSPPPLRSNCCSAHPRNENLAPFTTPTRSGSSSTRPRPLS